MAHVVWCVLHKFNTESLAVAYKKSDCIVPRQRINLHWSPLPFCGSGEQGVKLEALFGKKELRRGAVRDLGNKTSSLIHVCSGKCPCSCVKDLKILLEGDILPGWGSSCGFQQHSL